MIAGKWMDMLVGVDIHFVLVPTPAGPVPTPLPHPFVGIVYDPVGMVVGAAISAGFSVIMGTPFTGPVLINGLPAANTGIQGTNKPVMPHIPMPPGTAWAMVPSAPRPPVPGRPPAPPSPTPTPQNDASMITGSKTVFISGTNACRLGDLAMSCAEPIRLPSSTCIAIPMGMPVLIGGPPALDFMAALMSMIRTKWISDQLHALLNAKPGSWASKIICFFTGHPVDVASGMVVTDHVDFAVPGAIATIFDRTYFSRSTYDGPLGRGWGYRYDQFIRVERRRVVLHAGDGRDIYFYPEDGRWPVWNTAERLALGPFEGGWAVWGTDGLTRVFTAAGRPDGALSLTGIEDRDGNRVLLTHDRYGGLERVTDSEQRVFDLERDAFGRITAIHAPDPEGTAGQVVVSRFWYDEHGDLVAAADALGNMFQYTYVNQLLVQETDPTGHSFYFAYDGADQDAWCVRTWGDGGVFDRVLTYDKARGITVSEDSLGNATTYFANEAGLVVKQVDACGGIQEFEWVDGHLVKQTNPAGDTSQFAFDERGCVVKAVDPLGGERTFERDDVGRCTTFEDPTGARWAFTYERGMRPATFTPPAGETNRFEYDPRGNLTSVRDGAGRLYRFARSPEENGGLRADVSDPAGSTRVFRYDGWGRIRSVQEPDGTRIDLTYDLVGCLTNVQLPDGRQLRYAYDANRRRIAEYLPDGTTLSFRYGPFSKIAEGTDGQGTTVRFDRDTEGRLTRMIRADGRMYEVRYDACGRPVETTSFEGRRRTNRFDAAGRRVAATDAVGRATVYEYDACDQLTTVTGWDGYEAKYTYGPTGLLRTATNADAAVEFDRDAAGRVVAERAGQFALRWEFDGSGARVAREFEAGEFSGGVSYVLDLLGEVREHVSRSGRVVTERDPLQAHVRTRLLSGVTLIESFDAFARPTEQRFQRQKTGEVVRRRYTYDESGALAVRFEAGRGNMRFEHDRAHNLTGMESTRGDLEFQRDPYGRLVTNGPESFVLDEVGRLLRTNDETFEYDLDGCLTSRTETRTGRRVRYSYDSGFRLRRVTTYEGNPKAGIVTGEFSATEPESTREPDAIVEFDYDAFGRRVAKRDGTRETRYAWDGLRLALELEHPLGGSPVEPWEYHFRERSYVALYRTKSSRFEFFVPDQVGAPREVINSTGDIVWRGLIAPYGSILSENGESGRPTMRLPGQYADAETGLSYNGARYYDPTLARYLTPDPIGIFGSQDPYAYAADPLGFVDPWGLYIVALGRTNSPGNPTLLKDFAAAHPPAQTWGSVPNLPEPHEVGWGQWAHELIGNSEGTRFNLTGIDDVAAAFRSGQQLAQTEAMLAERGLSPGLAMSNGARVTDAELYQLLRRDGPLDDSLKKFFDKEGREVDIETLRKQCGI